MTHDYFRTCSIFVYYPKLFDLKDIREFKLVYRRINCHNIYCKEGKKKKNTLRNQRFYKFFFSLEFWQSKQGHHSHPVFSLIFLACRPNFELIKS